MRVCVIGAGSAGLAAIRRITAAPGLTGTVFEHSEDIGGIWSDPETKVSDRVSPMYKNLRTNLPKEVMEYLDFRFRKGKTSFVYREEVNEYLRDYAEHFQLRQYIQFGKRVIGVTPQFSENGAPRDHLTTEGKSESLPQWEVTVKDLHSGTEETRVFDAVMICTGNYYTPVIPQVDGIERFRGDVLHSRDYLCAESYAGKRVVVVGDGLSAVDISLEIAKFATEVLRCFRSVPEGPPEAENIAYVGPIKEVLEDGFLFENNRLAVKADCLLFATGYEYAFDFLDRTSGIVVEKKKLITPLYRHMIHTKYPTLCFIGIPFKVIPFYMFDIQARYFVAYLTGAMQLPEESEMNAAWKEDQRTRRDSGLPHSQCHMLGERQWAYYHSLAQDAGFADELRGNFQEIYDIVVDRRTQSPAIYKDDTVRILDTEAYIYESASSHVN